MAASAFLLVALLFFGAGSFGAILPEKTDVLDLFAGLPEEFVVEDTEEVGRSRVFRLRSAEPAGSGSAGPVYLRSSLTISGPIGAAGAQAELERRLSAADPDVGLSYAWDLVTTGDDQIIHLHAECTFSERSFMELARAVLRTAAAHGSSSPSSFWCRCGSGCRSGAPVSGGADISPGLPRVRRVLDDEQDEQYDNRLDPSGAWTGRIGELSLMHYANGLSFSYSAVFGPTAHICEGAGTAGLVATDRYEHDDEQGTVAFLISRKSVRLEVVDGIASFCGAGWTGDHFTIDAFEPPEVCTVAAERSHFHVVDTLDRGRRPAYVIRDDRVEVTPARHTGDQQWVLGRFVGPQITTIGLVARDDLECPSAGPGVEPPGFRAQKFPSQIVPSPSGPSGTPLPQQ